MNFLGKLLRVALGAALVLLLLLCRLAAGALAEPAWDAYAGARGLAPDPVGGPVQADTPFTRSVADPVCAQERPGDHRLPGASGDGGVYDPGPRLYQLPGTGGAGLAALPGQLPFGNGHGAGLGEPEGAGGTQPGGLPADPGAVFLLG